MSVTVTAVAFRAIGAFFKTYGWHLLLIVCIVLGILHALNFFEKFGRLKAGEAKTAQTVSEVVNNSKDVQRAAEVVEKVLTTERAAVIANRDSQDVIDQAVNRTISSVQQAADAMKLGASAESVIYSPLEPAQPLSPADTSVTLLLPTPPHAQEALSKARIDALWDLFCDLDKRASCS